jgi:hypothetical protein
MKIMAIKKKTLIGAAASKGKEAEGANSNKPEQPARLAASKKLAVAKLATAKLSTAKLTTLRKLN